MITTPALSSTDPQWKNLSLGTSGLTVGSDGCFFISTCNLLWTFAIQPKVEDLCRLLNKRNGFPGGFLDWQVLCQIYPQLSYYGAFITTNHQGVAEGKVQPQEAVNRIKRLVRYGFPVILHVDHSSHVPGEDHAVLLIDAPDNLDLWMIDDPDTVPGTGPIPFKQRYGSPLTGIYGWRVLLGPPTMSPDYSSPNDKKVGGAVGKLVDARYSKKDVLEILIT